MSIIHNEQFRSFVEEFIRESKLESKLTVDDVLGTKKYRYLKDLATQAWSQRQQEIRTQRQAEEDRQQAELNREKDEDAVLLAAALREKMGLKPLSPEELQEQISSDALNGQKVTVEIFPPSPIPELVIELKKKLGNKLPDIAFTSTVWAVTFRGWLSYWHSKKLKPALNRSDLSPEYREALENRMRQMKPIFDDITAVVEAWGLNPREAKTEIEDFNQMRSEMEVEGSRFYWLTLPPKVETPEEKAVREEAKAKSEVQQKIFGEFIAKLKTRLVETNPGLTDDLATKMATRLAKKYNPESDIIQIFTKVAVHKMASANGQEMEEQTAKVYAKAAGLSDEEFQSAVSTLQQERAAQSNADAEKAKQEKNGHGQMKPETIAAHQSKKKGQKEKKRGQQARQ